MSMAGFECLFRAAISPRTEPDSETKFVSVHRKGSTLFLQVRLYRFTPNIGFKPTAEGVSLSLAQTRSLIDQIENNLKITSICFGNAFLSPCGVHPVSDDACIIVGKEGREVLLLRKNGEGVKGISLSIPEYLEMKQYFEIVSYMMFPSKHAENVELIQPLAYEINFLLARLREENCVACCTRNGSMHTCLMEFKDCVRLYFEEATKRVQLPRVFIRVKFLHDVLKCENPLPPIEAVENYLKSPEWFMEEMDKESWYHSILRSFDDLYV